MTTNHSRGRERHDRGTLLAGLIALTALAAAVLLAISLAPASAETPAERCKRETTAYNNAWKNSWAASHPGKKPSDAPKPPVPYKCGGNNDGPPPTVQPTTTTPNAPAETTAPEETAPNDESGGPNLNGPTERRDIQHPGAGQAPIGGSTTETAGPRPTRSESATTTGRKPAASPTQRDDDQAINKQSSPRSTPFKNNVEYDKPSINGKTLNGCDMDYHRNLGGYGDCYPDYDYNVFNVQYVSQETIPGDPPVGHCETSPNGECRLNFDRQVSVVNTVSTSETIGLEAALEVKAVDAKISSQTTRTESTSTGMSTGNGVSISVPGKDLAPTYAADGYAVYAKYSYVLSKYDTRSKEVVWNKVYYYYEPVGLTYRQAARAGAKS